MPSKVSLNSSLRVCAEPCTVAVVSVKQGFALRGQPSTSSVFSSGCGIEQLEAQRLLRVFEDRPCLRVRHADGHGCRAQRVQLAYLAQQNGHAGTEALLFAEDPNGQDGSEGLFHVKILPRCIRHCQQYSDILDAEARECYAYITVSADAIEEECPVELAKALDVRPGVTAIIGGGGKTTLMECLAEELSAQARVIVCTTTHIYPEQNMPCLVSTSEAEIAAELARTRCVCVGSASESGKYSAPELPFCTLCALASYVIVEADGLQAPAAQGPCPGTSRSSRRRRIRPFWSWAHPASADDARKRPPRTDRRAGARRKRGDGRNAGALGEIFESGSAAYARSGQSGRERAGAAGSKSAGRRTFLPGVHGGITKGVDRSLC